MSQMLAMLTLKYFLANKKKTFLAVILFSIGLSMVLSTNLLISGLILRIDTFSSVTQAEQEVFSIVPENGSLFSDGQIEEINNILENSPLIDYHMKFYNTIVELQNGTFSLAVTNVSLLVENFWINKIGDPNNHTGLYTRDRVSSRFPANSTTSFNLLNIPLETNTTNQFTYNRELGFDLLLDKNWSEFPTSLSEIYNEVLVPIDNILDVKDSHLIEDLKKIRGIQINIDNPSQDYLIISGHEISNVLLLLQSAISILLIFSVTYVMVNLVEELKEDIKIFKMIGQRNYKIWVMIQSQAILISIFSFFISVVISLTILNLIFGSITLMLQFSYGLFVFDPRFSIILFLQSFVTGTIAGIYPAYVGVFK